jgi:predicted transcriptional regulator
MTEPHAVRLPDDMANHIEKIADDHDTTESEVIRHLLDNGLRATKYYPEEFDKTP